MASQAARTQILTREIGDTIRGKRHSDTSTPIDLVTRILGKSKHLDSSGHLTATWTLSHGFDAAQVAWRIGQVGHSEIGVTTVLG